ncbi:hypothetical protein L1987_84484 [Smallanthus sonchifolius]|uniref:Uncharacterized protein n=1 Tax=Smallanthus sonchifolius TaxID=185202 RepID=A0ACB8YES6_9ASTR|nr:hypothetical protein L1987_84484 [Smallanthus sonchifolius]
MGFKSFTSSRTRELARKLLQLTISKLSLDTIIKEYCSQLSPVEQQASSIEDILKLLKGERDEQRLAGLLLATKFCENGMGKGSTTDNRQDNQDAYLKLSLTILVAFVRVSSITSLDDMVNKIPIILEILSKELGPPLVEECLEILYLVLTTHNCGVEIYYKAGGLTIIRPHMSNSPQGSCTRELATKLFEFTLMHISMDTLKKEYRLALSSHEQQGSSIEDILKLLKGELDEQRLVGLLLATKFCRNDDSESILRVYNVGNTFLDRLLQTGNQSSQQILQLEPPLVEECLEILYLVLTSHSCGVEILYKAGGLTVINVHMSNLPEGSRTRELATKLLKFTLCHISMDALKKELCLALSRDATKVEAKLIDHMDLYRKLISTKVDDGDENNLGSRIEELLRVLHDLVSQLQASVSSEGLEIYSHTLTRHQEIHHDLSQAFNRLRSGLRAKRKFDRNIRQLVASVCTFLFLIYWSS